MKNRIRRLIPDNRWDMGMMENWLEDMAAEGWLLEKCGGHFATFERWEPRPCRFRLEPLGGRRQDRQEAAEELYAQLGWRRLCPMGEFVIFYCLDPDAPELQTDPVAENWLVEKLLKKTRRGLVLSWLFLLGCAGLFALRLLRSETPVEDLVLGTDAEIVFAAVLLPWLAWETVRALGGLRRMRRQMAAGFPRTHTGDWKKNRRRAAVGTALLIIFYVLWVGYPFWQLGTSSAQHGTEPPRLMGYQLDPALDESRQSSDVHLENPSFLSPIHSDLWETYSGSGEPRILSEYYSLRFSALAEPLYVEQVEQVRAAWPEAEFTEPEVPGMDYVTLARTQYNTFLIACRGKAVIYVGAFGVKGVADHLEDYAAVLAELQ